MKLKARIRGSKVHDVGYRVILLRKAMELGAEKFNALNSEEGGLQVITALIEGSKDTVEEFSEAVRSCKPAGAEVSEISSTNTADISSAWTPTCISPRSSSSTRVYRRC